MILNEKKAHDPYVLEQSEVGESRTIVPDHWYHARIEKLRGSIISIPALAHSLHYHDVILTGLKAHD